MSVWDEGVKIGCLKLRWLDGAVLCRGKWYKNGAWVGKQKQPCLLCFKFGCANKHKKFHSPDRLIISRGEK